MYSSSPHRVHLGALALYPGHLRIADCKVPGDSKSWAWLTSLRLVPSSNQTDRYRCFDTDQDYSLRREEDWLIPLEPEPLERTLQESSFDESGL